MTRRSSCWCLGWSFKDVSSATLPAAALSQWRLLLCCLSVSDGGAAGMKSVSLDPQVTPSCSSPTRELTPAEWKIKPLLIYDTSSLVLRWIRFGWFWTMSENTEAILFLWHTCHKIHSEDIDKNILLKREISDMTIPKTAQFYSAPSNTLKIIGSFFITYESQEAISH